MINALDQALDKLAAWREFARALAALMRVLNRRAAAGGGFDEQIRAATARHDEAPIRLMELGEELDG